MRLFHIFVALLGWVGDVIATSDNLTDLVTWDHYSLMINGSRVFIK